MKDLAVLILAAGKGTRMISRRAKVLHKVCGVPMVSLVCRAAAALQPGDVIVVVGQDGDLVRKSLKEYGARFVDQAEQLGTGHAMITARAEFEGLAGNLLVLYGDTPRIKPDTLRMLVDRHRHSGAATTLLTTRVANPYGYGRIIRNGKGQIAAIVEEKDASPAQRSITEINPGLYCFQIRPLVASLEGLSNRNVQGEYYLTDVIAIQREAGLQIEGVIHEDSEELQGINTRAELAEADRALRMRKNRQLMAAGVTMIDPESTYVDLDVELERDVTLYPQVILQGSTFIGEGATIHSGARITDSRISAEALILNCSQIADSVVGAGSSVGPFARIRDRSVVGEGCRVGNFVELKKTSLGDRSKAAHHAYLGDATIGCDVNIGAGVITCNYDGVRKHATIIEDGAFIGTDSQLVAPVRIGRNAYVAAGSCITADVPEGALAIARERQVVKADWVKRRAKTESP
ncbi:MAG: bifunctional UDP-N-acetylglucosamine diphosphorylase/glucosamine-1-phosphate N-acetyltransferase GlmU [Acidobacteria bacterium]|nr:bifunctional UDP-N-acetylglucosamine diphosphorylase/glucosamine-1-phosphate N-acetyltransferase GlmU [Acidobacteriota bacterium]